MNENIADNIDVVLQAFGAVERRDRDGLVALYHPEIEFHEAHSLPYGGTARGLEAVLEHAPKWAETWDPLQTEAEREMDPRVVAASGDEVVVLYRHRAVGATGEHFDGPVLGLYRVRDGKLARAQMFHFDTAAVVGFLEQAKRTAAPVPDSD
jgi:ketosteroid isomerase-like protein